MVAQNPSRQQFVERYEALIQGYNANLMGAEILAEEFTAFMQSLENEQLRHLKEGLTPGLTH